MKIAKVSFFLVGITVLCSCSKEIAKKEMAPVKVKVTMVSSASTSMDASYVGTIEESYGSQVSFAAMGTVSQVNVDEGSAVQKGQILAVLDKSTMANSYEIAKSTLAQTRDAYRRMNLLYQKGSLPEIKFIEIQTKLAQAEASERIARKSLSDCILRAPFSGYVSQRSVDVGNNVAPGITCFKIVKIDNVKIKVSIPEKEISQIRKGQPVKFTVAALDNREFTGIICDKGVQANPLSHTYDVKIEIGNRDHALLPGMVCNVQIRQYTDIHCIVVPQNAVLVDGEGTYVWIADGSISHRRNVTAGGVNNQGTVITSGLHDGEQVIVSGQNKVSDGSKITIQ